MVKPPPQLPTGNVGIIQGISENFAFHTSPELFITSRVLSYQAQNPDAVDKRSVVRAKILNRNVAIVSSRSQILQVLQETPEDDSDEEQRFVATAPYNRLMEPFFPPPNLLLQDGCPHRAMRKVWEPIAEQLRSRQDQYQAVALDFLAHVPVNTPVDLYDTVKQLSWRLILEPSLGFSPGEDSYLEFQRLQEDLLRGQFSLLPLSLNVGFWHSPRRVGIEARKKLQELISRRLADRRPSWLPQEAVDTRREEIVNHLLMFTSSLAAKGLASLLTAVLLNFFLFRQDHGRTVAESDDAERSRQIRSLVTETMRLSSPIVGVMRRATKDIVLASPGDEPDVLIPKGWDVWLYLAGSGRDEAAYGSTHDSFDPKRFTVGDGAAPLPPPPLAFGSGPKTCLGKEIMTEACIAVLVACNILHLRMTGQVEAAGVLGWLGWEAASPVDWAEDMKQLPTQHPNEPVMVSFSRIEQ